MAAWFPVHRIEPAVWPIRLAPLEDEITSSWIARVALEFGLTGHDFARIVSGRSYYWLTDPDILPTHPLLSEMGAMMGIEPGQIFATSLVELVGSLHETAGRRKMWVLARGESERKPLFGMQFCGRCLAEDKRPYFRRWWRLSLAVSCPRHRRFLSDQCPQCGAPIRLHLVPPRSLREPASAAVARCHNCDFDLRLTPSPKERRIRSAELHKLQAFYFESLARGYVELPGFGTISYSFLYFSMLWHALNMLYRVRRPACRKLAKNIRRSLSLPEHSVPQNATEFEQLRNADRRVLLSMVGWLFEDWPDRFVTVSRASGLTSSTFDKTRKGIPYWFARTVRENLAVDFSTRSEGERWSKSSAQWGLKYLKRSHRGYLAFRRRMRFIRGRPRLWDAPCKLAVALEDAGLYRKLRDRREAARRAERLSHLARTTNDDDVAWGIFYRLNPRGRTNKSLNRPRLRFSSK
jgi:hypothetical protein